MEWSSKMPAWDLADLEQSAELNVGSLVGPSFVLGSQSGGLMDCSVDLKLGGFGDFRQQESWSTRPPAAVTAVPSRRTRAGGNGGLAASCLVDGCKSDLSNSREYHRRHKVCEVHSKTPVVMVGGQEQRFCQQCSRFHQLVEFDEVKRSCRKRLDGHNRRRRKPQPESINPAGGAFANNHGSRFLMYPYLTPTPTQGHSWSIQPEDAPRRNIKQFPFLQDDSSPFGRAQTTLQPFLETVSSAKGSSSNRILAEGSPAQVFNSDCALSLLSSAQDASVGVGQVLPARRFPVHQSLVAGLPFSDAARASSFVSAATGFSCPGVEDEQVGNVFVCEAGAGLHCQNVLNVMGGGEPSEEASRALPFSWQ
ncbi:squamosa promoter-binding-like protein 16 [Curcuma longa]|uniref:squamosa promoter-binding-like protein 16 n=1 Tax=Curcuma longa TaxID=136217 RepID=UPI003D9E63D3